MPLFYFHLRTPHGLDPDEDGLVLADVETAYLQACAAIPEMAADFARAGLSPIPYTFVIADALGEILIEVPFSERLYDPERTLRRDQAARARNAS